MRRRFMLACWLVFSLGLTAMSPALARTQQLTCDDFVTQDAAQALLDADPAYADALDPDGNGVACEDLPAREQERPRERRSRTSPTPEPVETDPTPITIRTGASDELGGLGASRRDLEAEVGRPVVRQQGAFPDGLEYEVAGFDSFNVFSDPTTRTVVYLTLIPDADVDEDEAFDLIETYLPGDYEFDEEGLETADGILSIGFSDLLADATDANLYSLYEAVGEPGDFFTLYQVNRRGVVTAIEIGLGTVEATGPTVRPTSAPGPVTGTDAEYLTAIRGGVDTLLDSSATFEQLVQADDIGSDTWFEAFLAEMVLWGTTLEEANALTPPPGLEAFHDRYLAAAQLYSDASIDFLSGLLAGDQAEIERLFNEGFTKYNEGLRQLQALDQELTGLGG